MVNVVNSRLIYESRGYLAPSIAIEMAQRAFNYVRMNFSKARQPKLYSIVVKYQIMPLTDDYSLRRIVPDLVRLEL